MDEATRPFQRRHVQLSGFAEKPQSPGHAQPQGVVGDRGGLETAGQLARDHSGRIQINNLVDQNGEMNTEQKDLLTEFLRQEEFGLDFETVSNLINSIKKNL